MNNLFHRDAILDGLVQCMPDGVIAVDMAARVLVCNPAAVAMTGIEAETVLADSSQWADQFRVLELDGHPMRPDRVPMVRALAGETVDKVRLMISATATRPRVLVECSARPIVDANGEQTGALVVMTDVTQRHQAEQALANSREQQRGLIRNVPGIVFRCDIEAGWRMTFMSDAAERITGYPASYFVDEGHPWGSLMPPEDAERVAVELGEALKLGGVAEVSYRIRHRDGRLIWIDGFAHITDGRLYEGVLLDVSARKEAEQRESLSRARFQAMFQQASMFQAELDHNGILVDANELAFTATDAVREEVIGKPFWEGPWWGGKAESSEECRRGFELARDGTAYRNRLNFLASFGNDGELRHVDLSMSPVRDAKGQLINVFAVGVDVTDGEIAQAQLEESENRFRMLTEVSPQIIWSADESGAIDYINQTGVDYFGVPGEQIYGDGWHARIHPEDLQRVATVWADAVAAGEEAEMQYRMQRHDGEFRWHIARGVPLKSGEGRPTRWYGTLTDVEELRRAQAASEAATEAKSQFLANMSHEIRTPMNGVIGMTTLLRETQLDARQKECVNTIRASGEHLLSVINDVLDFSKIEAGRLELERYAFGLVSCVEDSLELVSASATRKNIELILDAPLSLPRKVYGDAGRLRQVLVNLLSNAVKFTQVGEVLVTVSVEPDRNEAADWNLQFKVTDTGIGIAPELKDRLFESFSQLDPSHARNFGGTGLGLAICQRLIDAMGGQIWFESVVGQGSTFGFSLPLGKVDETLDIDTVDFSGLRVLLVDDNATNRRVLRMMTEAWGFEVDEAQHGAEALRQIEANEYAIALLDFHMPLMDGVKLAREIKRRKGDHLPMMMLGSISTEESASSGHLFVASMLKPIRQSVLFDQLAIALGKASEDEVGKSAVQIPKATEQTPVRVLVAEDNAVNQKVAVRLLERQGFRADLAANGLEAVEAVRRQHYDLILMDIQMPEMDGFEATRVILETVDPAPPIIAVTANALSGDEQRCLDAGMQAYVSKPIDPRQLTKAIAGVLSKAGVRQDTPQADKALSRDSEKVDLDQVEDYHDKMVSELAELYEADGALELVETMQSSLIKQRADMDTAIATEDASIAARVVHSLKSTVRMVGANALGEEMLALELAFREGELKANTDKALEMLDRCGRLFDRLVDDARA